jgi:hypothetical protein
MIFYFMLHKGLTNIREQVSFYWALVMLGLEFKLT